MGNTCLKQKRREPKVRYASRAMGKTRRRRRKPRAPTRPTTGATGKTRRRKSKPRAPTRPTTGATGKTRRRKSKPRASTRLTTGAMAKTRQKKKRTTCSRQTGFWSDRQNTTKSNTLNFSCLLWIWQKLKKSKKGKQREHIRYIKNSSSGKKSRISHQIEEPQTHTSFTSTPASARSPKGTIKKHETECLRNKRKKNIDEFFASKIDIDKSEKKASVEIVDGVLSKIMSHVKGQSGGDIYCPNHVKAGSYPVNTKVGKADEFDINICLKLEQKDVNVRRNGKINYTYPQSKHSTNMNVKCKLGEDKKGFQIPNGNAIATVNRCNIPESLRHGNDVVPREMRYDLYHKIRTAINELNLKGVDLSRDAHGPALTMTIHPHKHSPIKHDISVDVTLSLPCDEPIKNWPRRATKKAFSESLIKNVKDTGTHLVPKKDEFWSVSYSRAERELFSKIDEGNGCRKFVYKILKKHLQTCKSRSSNGLPGLSSHILKTQLLWSCEKHITPGYWHHDKRDICLIGTISDLEETLKRGRLSDYFDTEVDVLKGKDSTVLKELTDYLHEERCRLELMQ